ncbi:MAG: hypothetical protein DRJ47_00215 [Thermoprotei archaeon]|nr:MAG: hypothetical protein DRJ47_00215 [Thermoprotei archaeon]
MSVKVAVTGGGPAGLTVASRLSSKGVEVTVFEEHAQVGWPVHCAGLVSSKGLELIGIKDESFVLNNVRGAIFYSPSGRNVLIVSRPEVQAKVIDRLSFDYLLYRKALKNDVNFEFKAPIIRVKKTGGNAWILRTNRRTFKGFDLLIDAEGYSSKIIRSIGIRDSRQMIPAIQYEIQGISDMDSDFVEIFTGKCWAPGFFAWLIPLSSDEARIGLASTFKPRFMLNRLILKHPALRERTKHIRIKKVYGGLVVVSGPNPKPYGDGFMLVGDAAGHVKPTTGGGVVFGILGALLAAKVVIKIIEEDEMFNESSLSYYRKLWLKLYAAEFKLMKIARKLLDILPDNFIENLFAKGKESGLEDVATTFGDIDFQSTVITKTLTSRTFLNVAIKSLTGFLAPIQGLSSKMKTQKLI